MMCDFNQVLFCCEYKGQNFEKVVQLTIMLYFINSID